MFGIKMFGIKKNKVEDIDNSRRGFLKGAAFIPAGIIVASTGGIASDDTPKKSKCDYLKKTWIKDNITYMEYELPQHVQPLFKHPEGRNRAISVPIYNVEAESDETKSVEDAKTDFIERMVKYIDMHRREEKRMVKYIGMHRREEKNKWDHPYVYIINVKEQESLFGVIINRFKLEFETNVYTVYS